MFQLEIVKGMQFRAVCGLRRVEIKVTERVEVKELHEY